MGDIIYIVETLLTNPLELIVSCLVVFVLFYLLALILGRFANNK